MKIRNIFCGVLLILITSLSSSHIHASDTLNEHYLHILRLMGAQNYDEAIKSLKKLISSDPSFPKSYGKIVEAYKWNNNLDEGLSYVALLSEQHPNNPYLYHSLGLIYKEKKNYLEAIKNFKHAISLAPEYPTVYKDLINSYNEFGKLDEAIHYLDDTIKSQPNNAAVYYSLGYACLLQQEWQKGLDYLDKSLKLNGELLDAFPVKGAILYYTSGIKDFLQICESGLKIAERINDIELKCNFLGNIGTAYKDLLNNSAALSYCKQSLAIAQEFGFKRYEAQNLNNLGAIYSRKEEYSESLDYYHKTIEKARPLGDRRLEALCYRNIGLVYRYMEDYSTALNYSKKSLPMAIEVGDKHTEALILWDLGCVSEAFGNYAKALEYYRNAYEIAIKLNNKWGEETYLGAMGAALWRLGNYPQALDYSEKALKMAQNVGDKHGEYHNLVRIGIIYDDMNEYSVSLNNYHQALKIAQEINMKNYQSSVLNDIGGVHHRAGDFKAASEYYQRALKIAQEIGNKGLATTLLGNIGLLNLELDNCSEAGRYINQALSIAREIKDLRREGEQLSKLGFLNLSLKDYASSLKNFSNTLEMGNKINGYELIWKAQEGLARVYEKQDNYEKSLDHYDKAIAEIEKIRGQISTESFKSGFLVNKIRVYERVINLLAKLRNKHPDRNYDKMSFQYAERSKSRALLDLIYQGKIFQNLTAIPDDVRQKLLVTEKKIENKHLALSNELASQTVNQDTMKIVNLKSEIEALERERSAIVEGIKENFPTYYQLTNPKIITVEEIQQNILNPNQILVEYFVGDNNILCWIITKQKLYVESIPITRKELEEKLTQISPIFNKEKKTIEVKPDHRWANIQTKRLNQLYQILLEKPAAKFLNNNSEIIIVPDDILYYFPFEILVTHIKDDGIHYLIESHPISYAGSASLLNPEVQKERLADKDLLAFGNPDFKADEDKGIIKWISSRAPFKSILRGDQFEPLPNAELEVKAIAENFKHPAIITGKQANEQYFKQQSPDYKFIHIATHHVIDDMQPMYSKIILCQTGNDEEDGYLQPYEVYNLRLNAEMVVLSGCNTGIGKLRRGEGLISMTRAFLYAGTPSMVVSLWPVDDESTALLMKYFYHYLKIGNNKSKALQKAKIYLIKSSDWKRDPFYWGSFVLIGDWKTVKME
jgi:CHAT domain-containing protein/Tfp pilus assembly protein PilF